jgi:PAS domain S-box-containing protein
LDQPTRSPSPGVSSQSRRAPTQAQHFLAAIVESSDDAIISKDLNGVVTSWNEGARRMFGYTAEEMIGQPILRLIPEELRDEENHILAKLRAGDRIEHFETTRVRKSGERIEVSATISPIRDDSSRIIGASKIVRDISDRKRTDERCFRLAAIVDSAADAIISKDLSGIITSWNEGARRMFGYTAEEMVGESIRKLIPDDLLYEEDEILAKLSAGGRLDHYETVRRDKNGELIDVSVTLSPIRNNAGQVIGISKIARNISDRKRMEKVVMQSEKLATTGRMAATIAHEINNPLASVINLIFLARQSCRGDAKLHEYLETAENELERVSHIARQTLGYYRDSGSPTSIHIHNLIENVLKVYRSKLVAGGIHVETSFSDLRKVRAYAGEITQICSNIISNAIDAMPRGGKLQISTRTTIGFDGDGIQTTIRDTGGGIAQEHLGRIFEPFFTTKGTLGTGIGLWVSRQLVERHGGQIAVTSSTEPGKSGTTVTIDLPFITPGKRSIDEKGPVSAN